MTEILPVLTRRGAGFDTTDGWCHSGAFSFPREIINKDKTMKKQNQDTRSMKAFASAENVIALTEGWRQKLKQFEGQEERNKYLTGERDSYREMTGRLNRTIKQMNVDIFDLQQNEHALGGENVLLKAVLERKGIDITDSETAEEPKRFSLKRILGITAVVAPYALIGSYVVSLYV